MSKIDEVRKAMVTAMKAGDKERKESLSMLLSALKNKAIDKREDLTEAEENEVVLKEIAPKMLNEDEIKEVIQGVLTELEITVPTGKDKGRIMKVLMPKVKGIADGKLVNQVLASMLQ